MGKMKGFWRQNYVDLWTFCDVYKLSLQKTCLSLKENTEQFESTVDTRKFKYLITGANKIKTIYMAVEVRTKHNVLHE